MKRRDTILVAVLMNTGLLAILFMMAISGKTPEERHVEAPYVQKESTPLETPLAKTEVEIPKFKRVETEEIVEEKPSNSPIAYVNQRDEIDRKLDEVYSSVETQSPPKKPKEAEPEFVEVTVKRGDALSTIAWANGTTVEKIKKANQLKSERIDIGQVLKVPSRSKDAKEITLKKETSKEIKEDPKYYTIQSGDNPWKLAKKFHVKFDDLLKLNNLNEEKARNLKPGDQIRVR